MKLVATLALFALSFSSFAQNCVGFLPESVFQQKLAVVSVMSNDQAKLQQANAFPGNGCMTSLQVQIMAAQFNSDYYRLEYCKQAWPRIADRENVYDVYNSFLSLSYALRFHDFIHNLQPGTITQPNGPTDPIDRPFYYEWPNYNYPSIVNYSGKTGCMNPMDDQSFLEAAKPIIAVGNNDAAVFSQASMLAKQRCLTMAQAMRLASLCGTDNERLQLLKELFLTVYDQENYPFAAAVLNNANLKNDWNQWCQTVLNPVAACATSDQDHNGMVRDLEEASFPRNQKEYLTTLNSTHCFSVAQIRKFLEVLDFNNDQLEMAKLLYHKCTDQRNYYQLKSVFTFSTDQDELMQFIQSQNN